MGVLRGRHRQAADHAARRRVRGRLHALLVRYDGPAEGHSAPADPRTDGSGDRRCGAVPAGDRHAGRRHVPVPRPAVPRGAAGLVDRSPTPRCHGDRDGALRSGGSAASDRAVPRQPHADGADDVRAPAQASRGGATCLRREQPASGRARSRAMPGGDQAPDDRVVGTDHLRVLLLHRGHRRHVHHERRMARPPGVGRESDARGCPHRGRRRPRGADRSSRHGLLLGRPRFRVPQRPGQDGLDQGRSRLDHRRRRRLPRRATGTCT